MLSTEPDRAQKVRRISAEERKGRTGGEGEGEGMARVTACASPKVMATKNEVKSESYVSHRMSFDVSHQRSE